MRCAWSSFLHAGLRRPAVVSAAAVAPVCWARNYSSSPSDSTLPPPRRELLQEIYRSLKLVKRVPVGQLASMMSDDSKHDVEAQGGLHAFLRRYPALYTVLREAGTNVNLVELTSGVPIKLIAVNDVGKCIAKLQHEAADAQPNSGPVETMWVSINDVWHVIQPETKYHARQHNALIDFMAKNPDVFEVDADGRRVRITSSAPIQWTAAMSGLDMSISGKTKSDPTHATADRHSARHAVVVRQTPSFFVPLTELSTQIPDDWYEANSGQLDDETRCRVLFDFLERMPPEEFDLRVLGDGKEDVYVRLVASGVEVKTDVETVPSPLRRFAHSAVVSVGNEIVGVLRDEKLEGHALRLDELVGKLPATVDERMPFHGPASILLFDRLRQWFDVDLMHYTVTLKPTLEKSGTEDGESFTLATSPLPNAIRCIAAAVRDIGGGDDSATPEAPLYEVEARLKAVVIDSITLAFGSIAAFIDAHPALLDLTETGKVRLLDGGLLPPTASPKSSKPMSADERLVREIIKSLPASGFIFHEGLRRRVPSTLKLPTEKLALREIFEKFPHLISVYDMYTSTEWVVQRPELPRPATAHRECMTIDDLLKEIAIISAVEVNENIVMQRLSKTGRMMTKAFGGLERLIRQLPEWFVYRNPAHTQGQGFVKYVGHQRKAAGSASRSPK